LIRSRKPPVARVDRRHLVGDAQRLALFLFEQLDQPLAAGQRLLRLRVELGAELAKASRSRYWERSRRSLPADLLHRLGLGVAADPGDRDADVDRRPDAGEEEVGLEKICPSVIEITLVGM